MGLRSGNINLSKNPAKVSEWNGSMAKAIEDAFREEWPVAMGDLPLPEVTDQMRLIFVSVAKGVVRHFQENPEAFQIMVKTTSSPHSHSVTVDGSTSSSSGGAFHSHNVSIPEQTNTDGAHQHDAEVSIDAIIDIT